jgi:hypothetical protein
VSPAVAERAAVNFAQVPSIVDTKTFSIWYEDDDTPCDPWKAVMAASRAACTDVVVVGASVVVVGGTGGAAVVRGATPAVVVVGRGADVGEPAPHAVSTIAAAATQPEAAAHQRARRRRSDFIT